MSHKKATRSLAKPDADSERSDPFYNFYKGWRGMTPENAVRLALSDHVEYSGGGSHEFIAEMRRAEARLIAYHDLRAALEWMAKHSTDVASLQRARDALDKAGNP